MEVKDNLLGEGLRVSKEIGFKDREEFIEEALNTYLAARKDKRIDLAIALYNKEKISIGKACEISGLNIMEFKKELKKRGIKRKTSGFGKGKT